MATPGDPATSLITFEYNANDPELRPRHRPPRRHLQRQRPRRHRRRRRRGHDGDDRHDHLRRRPRPGAPDQARRPHLRRRRGADQHPPGHRRRRLRRPRPPGRPVRPDGRHRRRHHVQPGRGERSADGDGVVQLRPVRVGHPTRRPDHDVQLPVGDARGRRRHEPAAGVDRDGRPRGPVAGRRPGRP